MKKLVAFFLAAVLVMGLTVTAFAASSPSTISASATIAEADQAAIDGLADDTTASSLVASGYSLKGTYSLESFDTDTAIVTISVPGLTSSDSVTVLQYVDGAWVKIDDSLVTVGDGYITVTVSSDGPLAVYADESSAAAGTSSTDSSASSTSTDGSTSSTSSSSTTSPTTGEAPVMAGFAAIIAIAAVGMLASRKRHFA